jgi:hypothetical protein
MISMSSAPVSLSSTTPSGLPAGKYSRGFFVTPSEAQAAKQLGIEATAQKWIDRIVKDWEATLATGRDVMWVEKLNNEVAAVQKIVVDHFKGLGYGFEEEVDRGYYCHQWHYRIRMIPYVEPKKEPGFFSQLLTRLFGGSHA